MNEQATTEPQENTQTARPLLSGELGIPVWRGQVIKLKDYGRVRFDRLDFYMGQCTAKLTGIDYPGDYYPFPEKLEREGFVIIDA